MDTSIGKFHVSQECSWLFTPGENFRLRLSLNVGA